jgi:ankyrin repeat protein
MDTKLHEAVRYGDVDDVVAALKEKLDPNSLGVLQWTPVHEAARTGEKTILYHLLAHGGR